MKRKLIILAAVALAACSTSEETPTLVADGVARFSSDISTRVSTDLSNQNSAWEAGDVVGIYMYSDADAVLRSDVPYSASEAATTTSFTLYGSEEAILYPNSGSVTFQAYSPYTDTEYLTIDLSDQTTEVKRNMMDYMISEMSSSASYESSATAVALTFKHQMAMLRFDVTCNETVTSIDGLTCTITSGLTATQSYDKITGAAVENTAEAGSINMLVEVDQTSTTTATITAIIHPEEITSAGVTFRFGGEVVATLLSARTFDANKIYSYPVEMGSNYATIGTGTVNAWGTVNDSVDMDIDRYVPVDLVYNGSVFEINSAAGLQAFADLVNGVVNTTATFDWGTGTIQAFSTNQQVGIDGVLTTNVNLGGSSSPWAAIGSGYSGTFDGGGHLVSGLYINQPESVFQGLFGYIDSSGVVKNVGVSGEVTGLSYVGGVVGLNGEGTVTNCYNTAAVTSGDSASYIGGVVGLNDEDSVTNCYNIAAVSSSGASASNIGGVVGGNDSGSVTYSYYNSETFTGTTDYGTPLLNAEMQSEVLLNALNSGAYLYNQDETDVAAYAWSAVTDGTPQFNTSGTAIITYDMEYYYGTYNINTAVGLYAFADLVNGELNTLAFVDWGNSSMTFSTTRRIDVNGTLTANVDLGGCEAKQWTPIANSDNSSDYYTGTFDGGGYLVSGLYINNTAADYQALIGCVAGFGTVRNVGVSGTVTGKYNVAGVVADSYGTVFNCYNMATITGTDNYVGGIVGNNRSEYVMNCYNTGAVEGYSLVGGITGCCGYSICKVENCYNSAEVTGTSDVGGVVGSNYYNVSVTNCYYNSDFDTSYTSTDGTPMTIVEMMSAGLVTALNDYVSDNSGNEYVAWKQVTNSFPILTEDD